MLQILQIALLICLSCSQQCRKFNCAEKGIVDPSDLTICAKVSNGVTTVGNCPVGKFCDLRDTESDLIRCHPLTPRKKLAGERYYASPNECFTGKADPNRYCVGANYGESCAINGDADCDVDLYCDERKICVHAKTEGEFCHTNIKCASYLICFWEDGVDTKCRPLGYYPDGSQVGAGDSDEICKSNFLNSNFMCEDGPQLTHSNLVDSPNIKCSYTKGESTLSECQYHNEGWAICKKGAKQMREDWDRVVAYFRKRPACHVSLPYAQCDKGRRVMDTLKEWKAVWLSLHRIHWENQMEGLLNCMKQWIHPEAFKYQTKNEEK